jgi:probable rRNA maturation factor
VTDDDGGHPPPSILVSDRQHAPLDQSALIALARDTLIAEGHAQAELSLSFVTDTEIAELHERYMHEPGPTDVLTFPLDEDDVTEEGLRMLGDVVVAPAVAATNNPADPGAELRLLVVHGVLHILGYDHEQDGERAEMWARQERYSGVAAP